METLPKVIEDTIFFVLPRNNRIGKSKFNNVSVGELALTISREIVERETLRERERERESFDRCVSEPAEMDQNSSGPDCK